ncbi:MAG: UDP-N-acetylmuramoyl-L-alanyl-D-glutamate--2,6-diaminopimelate ligase [Rhodospirillales bacterium]|nr:UDP-N-acetylmuramoyl-L-alanyl-D-glutamate--2,6-diaminopimelate ligase [Rhodospirillales bacterium]
MQLTELLSGLGETVYAAEISGLRITGLTADSRQVQAGFLFAALAGSRADGNAYIDDAVRRGAAAVLAARGTVRQPGADRGALAPVALIFDDNPRRRFSLLAARFYARQPKTIVAVTGTNGKTSVAWFTRQIWAKLGHVSASLGTLGLDAPGMRRAGNLTTPDPVALHQSLAALADAGVDHLAMEASSHGLDQYRLDGTRIAAAAFTNLTRDHLDYHQTMDAYLAAKLRLFSECVADGGAAVICADSPYAASVRNVAEARQLRVLTYGRTEGADLRIVAIEPVAEGQRVRLAVGGSFRTVDLPLAGSFQVENALAAAALVIVTGGDLDTTIDALPSLAPVRGRMERVAQSRSGASIYVDYAHTPDALAAALTSLRPQVRGRLVVVFGCGGDRDAGKRPQMGRLAAELADRVVITDDNPRSEDAAAIRAAIRAACPDAEEIGGRGEAIAAAVGMLAAGDVLLIAGKGHESGQIVGGTVLPFDDAEVARDAVRGEDA